MMQKTAKRIVKKASLISLILVFASLYWHQELIIYAFDLPQLGSASPVVVGFPPNIPDNSPRASYSGPHPSMQLRPEDNFPYPIKVGEVGPVRSLINSPQQYPWICMIERSGLGQPIVDNQEGIGVAIYEEDEHGIRTEKVLGYSKDCSMPTRAWYFYNKLGTKSFYPLDEANNDIAKIQVNDKEVDFIVRVEVGVINRFLYSITALKGPDGSLESPDNSHWNKKLIYQFRGGVGIGYRQGKLKPKYMLRRRFDALSKGYAVIHSTANQSSNTYNILLAEDTALRLKRQFTAEYGPAEYTMGIGGSGGAIQQYLIGQNGSKLLDGAIALYSYPDMLSQTTYGLDCELLEYYFDTLNTDESEQFWEERRWVEGLNAISKENKYQLFYQISYLMNGYSPFQEEGMSECSFGWRGPSQLVHNPRYFHYFKYFQADLFKRMHWTIWEDQKYIFGVGKDGYALQTWDNVGVQYGLKALVDEKISIHDFLKLNSHIGGWKRASEMQAVEYWLYGGINASLLNISPWSHHNMNLSPDKGHTPAQRTEGDISAMKAAYYSGNVFTGKISIPILDVRHYNDLDIDMHHSFASFETRLRMQNAQGHANNQIIWMSKKPHEPRPHAIDTMDRWLAQIKQHPQQSVFENKPADIQDACFDDTGKLIAKGPDIWNGQWNNKSTGECLHLYPNFMSSRNVAGAPLSKSIFKCHLQSVQEAMSKNLYGKTDIKPQLENLKRIFPNGVCDYSKGDQGRPEDL